MSGGFLDGAGVFVRIEAVGKGFACPLCDRAPMASRVNVRRHVMNDHGQDHLGARCEACGAGYLKDLKHVCPPPSASGRAPRSAPGVTKPLECLECGIVFPAKSSHFVHFRDVHGAARKYKEPKARAAVKDRKTYACDAEGCGCGQVFGHLHEYQRHVAQVTGVRTVPCPECGALFSNTGDMGVHLKSCLGRKSGSTWTCEHCAYSTTVSAHALGIHVRRMHRLRIQESKRFTCAFPGCEYAAHFQSKVAQHAVLHDAARPFACPEDGCGAAFKTKHDLDVHGGVHVDSYDVPCPEESCPKMFRTVRNANGHFSVAHGDRAFTCHIATCGKVFATKMGRDQHSLTHSDDRTYTCTVCGDRFKQKAVLDNHVAYIHTLSREHECATCGFVTSSPGRLATHASQAHGEGRSYSCVSVGEECIMTQLAAVGGVVVTTEKSPPGQRFRFDFEVRFADEVEDAPFRVVYIEFDGGLHFRPVSRDPVYTKVFVGQVHRDLLKSRYCLVQGVPLLRYQTTQGCVAVVEDIWDSSLRVDYPAAEVFTCQLVTTMRDAGVGTLRESVAYTVEDALELMCAASLVLSNLPDDAVGECVAMADAVAVIFAREFADYCWDDLERMLGRKTVLAFWQTAVSVPEFKLAGAVRDLGYEEGEEDGGSAKRVRGGGGGGSGGGGAGAGAGAGVGAGDPAAPDCWLCPKMLATNKALHLHVNFAHDMCAPTMCPRCPLPVLSADPSRLSHAGACPGIRASTHVARQVTCGLCRVTLGCSSKYYAHMNTAHGARFVVEP
jgi:KRAB domain-containing zinc finger protein